MQSIVDQVIRYGGRFVDYDKTKKQYYVVTMARARRKTSQALRETKELKWLKLNNDDGKGGGSSKKQAQVASGPNKNAICPFCNQVGHKTKAAKACLRHGEWVNENGSKSALPNNTSKKTAIPNNVMAMIQQTARAALPPDQQQLLGQYHNQQGTQA